MPGTTLQKIVEFAQGGAAVIFEQLPEDVPGYGRLEARRAEFKQALARLGHGAIVNRDIVAAVAATPVAREAIADSGVNFIRRATANGADYFFTNLTAKQYEGWTKLGAAARGATLLDPLSGRVGAAAIRPGEAGQAQVYLQLTPGDSILLRTTRQSARTAPPWPYRAISGPPVPPVGKWTLTFTKGGPEIPPALTTTTLASWTDLGGDAAKRFGGTARYRLEFTAPTPAADDWLLDLGDVRESARVRLNDRDVATAWSVPFRVRLGEFLRPGRNVLEVDVTNLAANRIRDMDQRKLPWKIMREINFVNINYKPFDASNWALTPSGLLGPVTLTPLRALKP
jgi:hypothetical protein